MSDGRKLILKAWNKARKKYAPVKRRQIETDWALYYNKENG